MQIRARLTFRAETFANVARRAKAGLGGPELARITTKVMADSIDKGFRGGFWEKPSGGREKWKKRHPLSSATGPLLGGVSGSIRRAIKPRPTRKDRVVFGSSHPGAAVHRGGSRGTVRAGVTQIFPKRTASDGKPAMWHALRRKGIHMSPEKLAREGVKVQARPHATANPAMRRELNQRVRRYLVGGS